MRCFETLMRWKSSYQKIGWIATQQDVTDHSDGNVQHKVRDGFVYQNAEDTFSVFLPKRYAEVYKDEDKAIALL